MKDLSGLDRFETEHLILRKARPDDTEYMLKNVWSDESLSKYMLWKPTFTKEEAEIIKKNYKIDAASDPFARGKTIPETIDYYQKKYTKK